MSILNDDQIAPFLLEFRNVADSAAFQFQRLKKASVAWIHASRRPGPEATTEMVDSQTKAFDALEAFLAAWGRSSLLVYPIAKNPFTEERGQTMRTKLRLPDDTLDDRELRDSWRTTTSAWIARYNMDTSPACSYLSSRQI